MIGCNKLRAFAADLTVQRRAIGEMVARTDLRAAYACSGDCSSAHLRRSIAARGRWTVHYSFGPKEKKQRRDRGPCV